MMLRGVACSFAGDLDRDGYEDLTTDHYVWAGSTYPDTILDATLGDVWNSNGYRCGDLNGDGWVDFIMERGFGLSWGIYLNNGSIHNFERGPDFLRGGYAGSEYASMGVDPAWDIDGDGFDDIIVFNPADRTMGELAGMVEIWRSVPTGIEEKEVAQLPEEISLFAYPNPFNNNVKIKFRVPTPSKVKLFIYDILGRKVKEIPRRKEVVGWNSINWSPGEKLPSGVYFGLLEVIGVDKKW